MTRPVYECAVPGCGATFDTVTGHATHATLAHTRAELATYRRPKSCWGCAAWLAADAPTCPECGWVDPRMSDRG